jgi:predicted HicB family RNase H-like nuclease
VHYKGYKGAVMFDQETQQFYGEVIGIKDVITFQGTSVDELEQVFKESVDDYLAWCNQRNELPEKSFSSI